MPLPRTPEDLAGLGFGRNLDLGRPIQCRDLDLTAEGSRRETDRHLAVQVVVIALKHGVRLDVDHDVKIARRAAVYPGFAFAREPDAIALVHARWNLDREGLVLLDAPRALARGAGEATILPLPCSAAGLLDREEALLHRTWRALCKWCRWLDSCRLGHSRADAHPERRMRMRVFGARAASSNDTS